MSSRCDKFFHPKGLAPTTRPLLACVRWVAITSRHWTRLAALLAPLLAKQFMHRYSHTLSDRTDLFTRLYDLFLAALLDLLRNALRQST